MKQKFILIILISSFNLFSSQEKFDYFDIPLEMKSRESYGNVKCDSLYYTKDIDDESIEQAIEILTKTNKFEKDHGKKNYFSISRSEREYLISELNKLKTFVWNDHLFPNSKALCFKDLIIGRGLMQNFPTKKEQLMCSIVYSFSKPIYFRNNKYALLFYAETYEDHQSINFNIYDVNSVRIPTEELASIYHTNRNLK
ncbi:hypothetical protein [Chryseobacterium sp. NKUCC03_KSP]|uniref:hypothetical protein n=1 Tax=Chryseobacterium sp. NKUCC03_KSP TaxID=2842125 RepID=UPI001C5AA7AF|nr:hypothetical protein [Chryseobacterium sp. NKUCC03_KSP]MBW3523538.1 hypothetical protein [Chryseobacterium sp. NKUCC03_KSP]